MDPVVMRKRPILRTLKHLKPGKSSGHNDLIGDHGPASLISLVVTLTEKIIWMVIPNHVAENNLLAGK